MFKATSKQRHLRTLADKVTLSTSLDIFHADFLRNDAFCGKVQYGRPIERVSCVLSKLFIGSFERVNEGVELGHVTFPCGFFKKTVRSKTKRNGHGNGPYRKCANF
jgi:hypothetical protein